MWHLTRKIQILVIFKKSQNPSKYSKGQGKITIKMSLGNLNYSPGREFDNEDGEERAYSDAGFAQLRSNKASTHNPANPDQREKQLFQLLNSQKPAVDGPSSQPVPLMNTAITDEDVAFLKAANEVVKLHESRVDPTIRDILNRLQYSNSPHGGMPFSVQYLKRIGATDNDNDLRERMSMLSTSDSYETSRNNSVTSHLNDYTNNAGGNSNTQPGTSPSYIVPPFTENPLRNPPNNLDFPQFSLDIFKSNDDIQLNGVQSTLNSNNTRLQNLLAQNLTASIISNHQGGLRNSSNDLHTDHIQISSLLNYPSVYAPKIDDNSNGINTSNNDDENNSVTYDIKSDYIDDHGNGYENGHSTRNRSFQDERQKQKYQQEQSNSSEGELSYPANRKNSTGDNSTTDVPRNYKCSNCGISFKRSSDLKRHEKIHLKVPPNICPLCHKGFARKDALKRHVDTLTCKRNRQRLLKQLEEEKNGTVNHV